VPVADAAIVKLVERSGRRIILKTTPWCVSRFIEPGPPLEMVRGVSREEAAGTPRERCSA
jgi:hypothetical protein